VELVDITYVEECKRFTNPKLSKQYSYKLEELRNCSKIGSFGTTARPINPDVIYGAEPVMKMQGRPTAQIVVHTIRDVHIHKNEGVYLEIYLYLKS
jgi:hypothetical protein